MGSYVGGHNASRQQTIKDKRTTKRNQNRSAAFGRPEMKLLGGGGGVEEGGLQLVCGRPTLVLSSALVPQALSCLVCVEDS